MRICSLHIQKGGEKGAPGVYVCTDTVSVFSASPCTARGRVLRDMRYADITIVQSCQLASQLARIFLLITLCKSSIYSLTSNFWNIWYYVL